MCIFKKKMHSVRLTYLLTYLKFTFHDIALKHDICFDKSLR